MLEGFCLRDAFLYMYVKYISNSDLKKSIIIIFYNKIYYCFSNFFVIYRESTSKSDQLNTSLSRKSYLFGKYYRKFYIVPLYNIN